MFNTQQNKNKKERTGPLSLCVCVCALDFKYRLINWLFWYFVHKYHRRMTTFRTIEHRNIVNFFFIVHSQWFIIEYINLWDNIFGRFDKIDTHQFLLKPFDLFLQYFFFLSSRYYLHRSIVSCYIMNNKKPKNKINSNWI